MKKKKSLKQEVSCLFSQPQNVPVLNFLSFYRPQWQISLSFVYFNLLNPYLLIYLINLKPQKGTLLVGASPYGPL